MSGQKVSAITVAPGALAGVIMGVVAAPAVIAAGAVVAAGAAVAGLTGAAISQYQAYRQAREVERLRREREMLKRARERAANLAAELNGLKAQAKAMHENGLAGDLPDPPQLPEVDNDNVEALYEFVADNEAKVAGYRTELNRTLLADRSALKAEEGRDRVLQWYGSYASGNDADAAARQTTDEDLLGRSAQSEEIRREILGEAHQLMAQVDREVVHVSEGLRRQLASLLSADSLAKAQIEKARLRELVDEELARTRKERKERAEELAKLRIDSVAALMARTLEEMGYVVSGTDEAAYVRDGRILAHRSDWKDHAVRLTIDHEAWQVATDVVRLVDGAANEKGPSAKDARKQDMQADADWCGANGIGKFRQRLENCGIGLNFKPGRAVGHGPVASVSLEEVLDASPSLENHLPRRRTSSREGERSRLRARAHDADRRNG